jgi:sulfotransferase
MTKTYHFMDGLPRSGSTVLSAILNQNPQIYSSPQTDLLEMLYQLEMQIPNLQSYRAGLLFPSYDSAIRSIPDSFYKPINKPVVIDKNRGWGTPYNWDNLSPYLNPNGKVILTMRPILQVLASFVRVAIETEKTTGQLPYLNQELWTSHYKEPLDAVVDNLMIANGEIERAIFSIANLLKNHKDRVHVVWMDDLTNSPKETLDKLYSFLGLEGFEHDFDNIQEVDKHNDLVGYGVIGLHDIKKKLAMPSTNPEEYLSNYVIDKYKNALDFLDFNPA